MTDSRRILITGTTRGLGRALAERYAANGHRIVGCGRNADALAELAASLTDPPAGGHRFDAVDVANGAAVVAWAASVLPDGAPDLIVNNAGVINRRAPLWEVPEDEFSRVIDVNIKGVNNVIRAFLPAMIAAGRGVVVNISSGWGHEAAPEVAPYCATKFAIEGLTRSLAQELPPGLAAVPLSPGIINTDMLQSAFGAAAADRPSIAEWVDVAAPYILKLGPDDNGKSQRIPVE